MAVAGAALVALLRPRERSPVERVVRFALAAFLTTGLAFALVTSLPLRGREWLDILPLHLCDLAVLVAVWALVSRQPIACEVLYFWALSGTALALLMPDVGVGFPDVRCVSFFALHGAVLVSALLLVFGLGAAPRAGAWLRVFWITNAYAAGIALIDFMAGENFMYLRAKPSQPSILDGMGPWPWYIFAADALAFLLFWALARPFSKRYGDNHRQSQQQQ